MSSPRITRPHFPPGYVEHARELLPWSHVEQRLTHGIHSITGYARYGQTADRMLYPNGQCGSMAVSILMAARQPVTHETLRLTLTFSFGKR